MITKKTKKYFILFAILFCFFVSKSVFANSRLQTLQPSSNNLGLIGWWSLDGFDIVNGRVMDRTSTGAHGTPIDIATSTFYISGKIGQGISLDGVDDCVRMGDVSAYNFDASTSFTVSGWYKRMNNSTAGMFVAKKGASGNTTPGFYYNIITSNGGIIEARVSDGTNQVVHSSGNVNGINDGRWHYLAIVVDRSAQTINSFVDGVAETASSISTVGSLSTSSHFALGARSSTGTCSTPTPISLDDVRVYNRALSQSEIIKLYNSGSGKVASLKNIKVANGLVGAWSFDGVDIVNGRVMDRVGGYHGNLSGIATSTFYTLGKLGQAFNFDGTDDTVRVAHNTAFTTGLQNGMSISAWIKLDSWGGSSVGRIIDKSTDTAGTGGFNFLVRDANDNLGFSVNGGTLGLSSTNSIVLNKWTHVIVTASSAGTITFYIDGVQSGTPTSGSALSGITTTNDMYIGSRSNTDRYFDGLIDDVRVYNKVLSVNEIQQLYNLGGGKQNTSSKNVLTSGLLANLTFDGVDITNGRINDVSGNSNHGTTLNIASSTFYTIGKTGQGVRFDGINDRINFSGISLGTSYTASVWVRPTSGGDTGYATLYADSGVTSGLWIRKSTMKLDLYYSGADHFNNTALPENQWTHVVVVNNAGTATFYINGVSDGTAASAPAITVVSTGSDGNGEDYLGTMDSFRLYNRALSATEVRQLYELGK